MNTRLLDNSLSGCGVARDRIALIFKGFPQTEGAMKAADEGTGLGLPIAKTLVEGMGGRIGLEEKPNPAAKLVFTVFPQPTTERIAWQDCRTCLSETATGGGGRYASFAGGRQPGKRDFNAGLSRQSCALIRVSRQRRRGLSKTATTRLRPRSDGHSDGGHGWLHSNP